MPLYEYVCPECNGRYELRRPFAQSGAPYDCPQCGAETKKTLGSVFVAGGSSSAASGASCEGCGSHSCGSCSRH